MKKPTIEELTNLIKEYNCDYPVEAFAQQIDDLYNPPLKPLSELHKDREACEKVAEELKIRGHSVCDWGGGWTIIVGLIGKESCKLGISGTGEMFLEIEGFTQDNYNFFSVTKLILSMGYDVQPEKKEG